MRSLNRNLGFPSRMARGVIGTLTLIVGIIFADFDVRISLLLVALGTFAILEAVMGRCPKRNADTAVKEPSSVKREA